MEVFSSPKDTQKKALRWKRQGTVALVPTMGCLHEAHSSLVRKAKDLADKVIVSIFVNPIQFSPNEDYQSYPRTFDADSEMLEKLKVDLIFHPTAKDLYSRSLKTRVKVGRLANYLCGRSRGGHFDGVATICLKLLEICQPDFAVFGKKDYQQLRVIEQMVSDFNLPVTIVPHEIVRETDGLAMSSRNRYLDKENRALALRIPQALEKVQNFVKDHRTASVQMALDLAKGDLSDSRMGIDYIEIADSENLVPADGAMSLSEIEAPRMFVAIKVGPARLIDNISLGAQ